MYLFILMHVLRQFTALLAADILKNAYNYASLRQLHGIIRKVLLAFRAVRLSRGSVGEIGETI